jgi:PST family polysaccharide transporter
MLKFAMHTYGNFTLNYFSRNIDKLLTGWRYGAQSLGYYKKAYDLFALPANQLISPISNVALAALSRLTNEPEKYRRYYLNAITIIAFIGMPLSAILTLAGYDIILLVLGPQWTKAGEIFCYFGASIGIMLIYGTQGWLHLSLGRPDRWFKWGVIECVSITCFFVVGLQFGIAGMAIAYSLAFYILAGPCLWYAGKPIDLKVSSLFSAVWRYFSAALLAGLTSFFILYHLPFAEEIFTKLHVFFRIVSASALCAILYLILVILFYQSIHPVKNFFSIARQMLPAKTK